LGDDKLHTLNIPLNIHFIITTPRTQGIYAGQGVECLGQPRPRDFLLFTPRPARLFTFSAQRPTLIINRHVNTYTMAEPTSTSLHSLLVSIEPLDVAKKVFVSFLLVSACFFVLFALAPASSNKKSTKQRASWALKAVSVVHALIVAGASVWALFYEPGMHEITTGVLQRDAEAVRFRLIHARSDVLAAAAPLTLAYFLFDLLLVPVWEGRLTVSADTWEGEKLRLI